MSDIKSWSSTAGNNNAAPPNGAPEGMAPSSVNDTMREMMAATRRWYESSAFIDLGHIPTYVSTTSFTIPTDVTAIYHANRRLQATVTAGVIYGTIQSSSYAAPNTTVNVTWDAGALDSGLSSVAPSALPANNDPIPRNFQTKAAADAAYVSPSELQNNGFVFVADTGAADAMVATLSPAPSALVDGMEVAVRAKAANATTTPTLNLNNLGAKTVTKYGGQALAVGDIAAGLECRFRYVASPGRWELLNPVIVPILHGRQVFTANGTFTPETDTIWVSGAGGGGGGANATNGVGGGGGDSCLKKKLTVTIGQSYTVTIGQSGVGSTTAGGAGNDGSTTSLGAILTLAGGKGGSGNSTPGAAGGSGGTTGGLGSSVSGVGNAGGNGGDTLLGSGGRCASWGGAGGNGSGYGSGGAGTGSAGVTGGSGAGAPGVLIIEW